MEGLKVIEKSWTFLEKFKKTITSDSFSKVGNLAINITNYDMQTQSGIKTAIGTVLEVYKDDLDLDKPIQKVLTGDMINIKIPDNVDGFREDLVDSLKNYIEKRAPELWNIISNNNSMGGIYSV